MGLTEDKQGALYAVSDLCFKATLKAEITFRGMRDTLKEVKHLDVVDFLVDNLKYVWNEAAIPTCHDITTKFMKRYITMRFQAYGLRRRQQLAQKTLKCYGSKSMAMHTSVA